MAYARLAQRTLPRPHHTVEDPVEFVLSKIAFNIGEIGWMQLGSALKNMLRQAPNVILMGEIRDRATMEHAVVFAETGHLCLATLHANSANQALDRIINFFPDEQHEQLLMDLSLNLKAIDRNGCCPVKTAKGAWLLLKS